MTRSRTRPQRPAGPSPGPTRGYREQIGEIAARIGRIGVDPRHVEAWMRLEHSTLDGLALDRFTTEVAVAIQCIDLAGTAASESLAHSFGL